jgi:hypothetical protein
MGTEGLKPGADPIPEQPPLRFRLPSLSGPPAKTVLTVAAPPDPDVEYLKNDKGEPVWPVRSRVEMEMLRDVARLFGGEALETAAVPGTAATKNSEVVIGVGRADEEAALYAHLTGRISREVESVEELSGADVPAVVLACGPELDRDLLQWVFLLSYRGQAPGIIWGRDFDELHRQVLSSAGAATLNGPARVPHHVIGDRHRTGVRSMTEELGLGAGVLHLTGHGDGVSQGLGVDGALCQRPHVGPDSGGRGPECVYTGFCKVVKKSVSDALAAGSLIPPDAVAARVLVNGSCHGISFGKGIVDPRWATFPALASNPRVGALVAVPELSIYRPGTIEEQLVAALRSGEAVGKALARFEEDPTMRELGFRFVLFGDPAVRAVPPSGQVTMIRRHDVSVQRQARASSPPQLRDASVPGLEILRQIALDVKADTRAEGEVTSRALLDAIGELEETADKEEAIQGTIGHRIREAVLAHLETTKARLFEAWQGIATVSRSETLVTCPYCGWRSYSKIATLAPQEEREFRVCAYCSDIEDAALPRAQSVSLDLPSISRDPAQALDAWAAAVYVVRSLPDQTQRISWPRGSDGLPVLGFKLPVPESPQGPVRIYAVSIDGISVSSVAAPMQGMEA